MNSLKDLEPFNENKGKYVEFEDFSCFMTSKATPYLVYLVFKNIFGDSNLDYFQDNKRQWGWIFQYKDFYIKIYAWNGETICISVYHHESVDESKMLGKQINALLLKFSEHNQKKLKIKIANAKFKILENAFVTYYQTGESLLSLSKSIDNGMFFDTDKLWDKRNDLLRSAFLMFLSSFEGFMNIIYELYLKAELRAGRIKEKISREQIDVKLTMMPVYCNGFKTKTIDQSDERFKNYLRLVSLRNDYVHANLIKSLERYSIEEDGYTFIIENEDNLDIPSNINQLEYDHVHKAKGYIDGIVELVVESMKPKTKKIFEEIIYLNDIQIKDDNGIFTPVISS
ncbi:hypothetical protein ABDJ41_08080 [Pedobacter sp. ASV1-7]|uniref:hypothetical protein n=1 Tax=Pedobacter sp. ASV1-7 TaxID=3145237 RepID=UPI0032E86265